MGFNKIDYRRNQYMLTGKFARNGYDWWWHSFTAIDEESGEETPFFVEFFIINPSLSPEKVVLGQSKEAKEKGLRPSYLMVKAGAWGKNKTQLHRFFPLKDVTINRKGEIAIKAGDCFLTEHELKAKISVDKKMAANPGYMSDEGEIELELKIDKNVAFNVGYGTSKSFCDMKAFQMYWHAQGMKSYYEGHISLNGRKYRVERDKSFGYADKNWGSGFTSPWVWLSSNDLYSTKYGKRLENSVFDIGGGCPKAFGIPFKRKLLSAFYYEGRELEFNFSKFWNRVKTEFSYEIKDGQLHWYVKQSNRHYQMETRVSCDINDMLFVNYEDPEGKKRFTHLYNGGNGKGRITLYKKNGKAFDVIDEIEAGHIGCEYGEFDPEVK